jgi:hypothetical protein
VIEASGMVPAILWLEDSSYETAAPTDNLGKLPSQGKAAPDGPGEPIRKRKITNISFSSVP